ncbi:hypothetical protein [Pseudomonas sp.]|uniref:hypothetical protein n=1 Tax=Pseudomonas sp. TaxID=306 RepID=UPI0028A7762D|nr:hypothetical protein [Pseudomonas sp.]
MRIIKETTLALALTLSGCASFTQDQVAPVDLSALAAHVQQKNVYVRFEFGVGPLALIPKRVPQGNDRFQAQIKRTLEASGLFGRVSFDQADYKPGDYFLAITATMLSPESSSEIWMTLLSALTYTLIPAKTTDRYRMELVVVDPRGENLSSRSNEDGVDTWMGIWFLPMVGNTDNKAVQDTFDRQLQDLLRQSVSVLPAK